MNYIHKYPQISSVFLETASPSPSSVDFSLLQEFERVTLDDTVWRPSRHPEHVAATAQELIECQQFMSRFGRQWWLAGGTSLELGVSELTRTHKDVDIVIERADAEAFYEYALSQGYEFFCFDGSPIDSLYDLTTRRENAFLHKVSFEEPGPEGFEVIFARRDGHQNILFSHKRRVVFSRHLFEEPRITTLEGLADIPLEPAEVVLFHKLYNGSLKDVYDLQQFLPTLNSDERDRLEDYTSRAIGEFSFRYAMRANISDALAMSNSTIADPLIKENVLWSVAERLNEDRGLLQTIIDTANTVATPNEFYETIKKDGDYNPAQLRACELGKAAFLLLGGMSSHEYVGYEIRRRLSRAFLSIPAWFPKSDAW